ncbi:manganese-dependent inorganic pyrophosphatase [Breznakia sp. PF5-3]|uniref:putative manganese-dependent inorganic diphosphatase n=1 Tax=unclassified Breznakia TaxID=2623764 RepID=UPI00240491B7|nr:MULTISPECIES: putative manganese-dependent inorganic diphosphatase [unclassified Breznakia]MDF9823668.1 manganese-dependent inorganic pyrophosphatase [Breznakia sp. PM6-1]MDF9834466.1 manganese-dependent inorganic pyrophosphatase [Breznakia sp. PF5-3]MDF9838623.1 manganese-dependent inorganic pyrophosphatase [Breznakia sp. PFB2-8]MDF9860640.1 manganese-dependent inorganic pyrophosphatase [Breznakia sp. PH5-24]
MKDIIYITGHKNPDSDSICSAIAYSHLKNELGIQAKPCRLGKLNTESQFILDKFNLEEPDLITSAKAALRDIDLDTAVQVDTNTTLRRVWDLCLEYNTHTVYVVNEKKELIGLTTLSDISKIQMQDLNITKDLLKETPLINLVLALKGDFIYEGTLSRSGYVRIADKKLMERDIEGNIMVLSDNEDIMLTCMEKGCAVIAIAESYIPTDKVIDRAMELGVTLIKTQYNIMKILQMIYRSIPVGLMMTSTDKIQRFNGNEFVEDVAREMLKARYRNYPVFMNGRLIGSMGRFHVLKYSKKKLILLDHNERSQSIDDIEYGNILEIVDHHRIGDIETNQPIIFRNQNVGSTCTIVGMMYREHNITPPADIAGALCCAIISDTMNFHSPTCTEVDRDIAKELAELYNYNLDELATEMFKESAKIKGKSNRDILYTDFKEYEIAGKQIAIGQAYIYDMNTVACIEEDFQQFLEQENEVLKYDLLMMAFSNVEGKGSKFVYAGKLSHAIKSSFFEEAEDENFMKGLVSRKKQIIPKIASLLK